jgi:alpha-mannosidase II
MAWKILGRKLESVLRSADIFFSLSAHSRQALTHRTEKRQDFFLLQEARQNLGLFQHHDGITGTSTDHNMNDLGRRLVDSIMKAQKVLARAVYFILALESSFHHPPRFGQVADDGLQMDPIVVAQIPDVSRFTMKHILINIYSGTNALVILTNSLPQQRQELIYLHVNNKNVKVLEATTLNTLNQTRIIPHQINPYWSNNHRLISRSKYVLIFMVELGPLEIKRFAIQEGPNKDEKASHAEIDMYDYRYEDVAMAVDDFVTRHIKTSEESSSDTFILGNGCLAAEFDTSTGHLMRLSKPTNNALHAHSKNVTTLDASVEFRNYHSQDSGAYLFHPLGEAKKDYSPIKVTITRMINH